MTIQRPRLVFHLTIALAFGAAVPAYADNCGSLQDCFATIAAALAVLVALVVLVTLVILLWEAAAVGTILADAVVEGFSQGVAEMEAEASFGEYLAAEEAAATEAAGGSAEAGQAALQFGENDLVYGPSADGALRQLADEAGGRLLTDLPKPPDLTWTEFSTQTLDDAAANSQMVRFNLTNIEDVAGTLDGTGEFADSVTGDELRYIQQNWERFQDIVRFYMNGQEVGPPW